MSILLKNKDTLFYKDFIFKCSIGKKGLSTKKVEGDKKTPVGTFSLDKLYYRHDRIRKPKTKLKCIPIKKNMGWCDDIKSKKNYNRLINIKQKVRYEKMHLKLGHLILPAIFLEVHWLLLVRIFP